MYVLPESFKHEKDPNFPSRPSYYTTGLKCIKQLSLLKQADLFKKSKLSVHGEKIISKLANCFQEGYPGTSVAK